ncbi:hypothetical protein R3P38DRAFT_2772127 [Favolaschia claudopus]|uniref:Uncharacterized protein n=1 Tax=Favolaschia claudopus TaxID=2862362 RepID=A0AAW0C7R6_9AGAR
MTSPQGPTNADTPADAAFCRRVTPGESAYTSEGCRKFGWVEHSGNTFKYGGAVQDDSDSDHSNRSYNENEPNTAASFLPEEQMQIFSDRGFSVHSADARHEPQGEGEFRDGEILDSLFC